LDEALQCTAHLLDDKRFALPVDQRDAALTLRARCLRERGEYRQAFDIAAPVLERIRAGSSGVDPVDAGHAYLLAAIGLADGDVTVLLDGIDVAQDMLRRVTDRSSAWWRLAATIMWAYLEGRWTPTTRPRPSPAAHPTADPPGNGANWPTASTASAAATPRPPPTSKPSDAATSPRIPRGPWTRPTPSASRNRTDAGSGWKARPSPPSWRALFAYGS
jgi:hypothetical protein